MTIPTYRAVPSIFIVAPRGKTVEETTGLIPKFSSAQDIEIGKVAELDEVEKAISIASLAPKKNLMGGNPSINFIMMNPCINVI